MTAKLWLLACLAAAVALVAAAVIFTGPLPVLFAPGAHRFLHVLGAVVFLGNIVVGALWMIAADASKSPEIFRFSIRAINLADIVFTAPGALLLILNGSVLAGSWSGYWRAPWLRNSLILFAAAGLAWVAFLVPMQVQMEKSARDPAAFAAAYHTAGFRRRLVAYFALGSAAAACALVALYLMVVK
jgi:uncharacterized membrane protein